MFAKAIFCLVFQLIILLPLISSGSEKKIPVKVNNETLVKYLNTFTSINELIQSYEAIGIIKHEDAEEIFAFIKNKNIDLNAKPTQIKLVGNKYVFGKVGWTYQEDGTYKTLKGRIVRVGKNKTGAALFKEMYNALSEQEATGFMNMFINKAYAGETANAVDSAIGAASPLLDHAMRILGSGGSVVNGIAFSALGGIIEGLGWPLRKFIYEGRVMCASGYYKLNQGYTKADFNTRSKIVSEACQAKTSDKRYRTEDSVGDLALKGESETICRFGSAAIEYFNKVLDMRANEEFVADSELKTILNSDDIKSCTKEKALIVEKSLKEKANRLFALSNLNQPAKSNSEGGVGVK